ncbi:hypothetical protein EJD97_012909 [Solanum chilense]|uniref:Tf2-1-like SH3-like domain-containing protein n=1 Tax=Solanum chilense TaxID=4083 RepID=A0A6N2CKG3_SOLCI|nr:hypothetical protein EJD97_012909 [Solanum chilense]
MSVLYHPGRANVVADALICMTMGSVSHVEEAKKDLVKDVHRLCVPNVDDLRNQILEKAHGSCDSIHLDSSKMYHDLREVFWFAWDTKATLIHMGSCDRLTKSTHFIPVKSTYSTEDYARIFVDEIVCHHDLYGRRCRSPIGWFELGESSLLGPELIYKTMEKVHIIRNWLKTTYNRQKSYVDHRRRDLEFEDGDKVYIKISPMKGVARFGKKGKLSPCYLGPYEILQRVGKYISDPESIVPIEGLGLEENLFYEEVPVEILDSQVKKLRNKEVDFVKGFMEELPS